jgi:hypothetical protein
MPEVDRGLGMSGSPQNSAFASQQRIDVSGTHEIRSLGPRIDETPQRHRAVEGTHSGPRITVIDRDQEGRLMWRGIRIRIHERSQLQPCRVLLRQRGTQNTCTLPQHKVDRLRGHQLGSCDEISLVLPFLGIQNDDQLSLAESFEGGFDLQHRGGHGETVRREGRGVGAHILKCS